MVLRVSVGSESSIDLYLLTTVQTTLLLWPWAFGLWAWGSDDGSKTNETETSSLPTHRPKQQQQHPQQQPQNPLPSLLSRHTFSQVVVSVSVQMSIILCVQSASPSATIAAICNHNTY